MVGVLCETSRSCRRRRYTARVPSPVSSGMLPSISPTQMRNLRIAAALLCSLLMLLPWLWIFSLTFPGWSSSDDPSDKPRLVPHLPDSTLRSLHSHRRRCNQDSECEFPLSCLLDPRGGGQYCADSSCMTDADCREGLACRPWISASMTARFLMCAPVGPRKEGELCQWMPDSKEAACERGLLCNLFCGRPCDLADPKSCPEGFFCKPKPEGALCMPTCKDRPCPEGQSCIRASEGTSYCARVEGQNCQQVRCPPGYKCSIGSRPETPGVVWMECTIRCTEGGNECPEGEVCFIHSCVKSCDPQKPDSCGTGSKCQRIVEGTPWHCRSTR